MIKPDGVKRGLVGEVLHRIERRGFKNLKNLEMRMATPELLEKHYEDLVDRPFFPINRRLYDKWSSDCWCYVR